MGVSPYMQMITSGAIWKNGECLWKRAGVWSTEGGLLKPYHFAREDVMSDYYLPFVDRFCDVVKARFPLLQVVVGFPGFGTESEEVWRDGALVKHRDRIVCGPHLYDPITIFARFWFPSFSVKMGDVFKAANLRFPQNYIQGGIFPIFGAKNIVNNYANQLLEIYRRAFKAFRQSTETPVKVPGIVGECGGPFNMRSCCSCGYSDSTRDEMIDRTVQALEANFLCYTLWNYNVCNSEIEFGDQWNLEDFSFYSAEHQSQLPKWLDKNTRKLFAPLRAVKALTRPYALILDGEPISQQFNMSTRVFELAFDAAGKGASVIFVPVLHFHRFYIYASAGLTDFKWFGSTQEMHVWAEPGRIRLRIKAVY